MHWYLGSQADDLVAKERQATLKMLVELLKSVEQIDSNVTSHNSELQENAHHVGNLQVSGEMESVRQALLDHMTALLTSNKRLQQDVVRTRYPQRGGAATKGGFSGQGSGFRISG